MKLRASLLLLIFATPFFLKAQTSTQLPSGEIKQDLEALNVVGSVLYIAAHPDDENTRLLAYLAKGRKLRTGYLSLTRGDGGQNLIGNEQADLLGLIRTQELLAARRTDGAEQFFTRANDFGFSKNPEESFKIWGKQQILGDVVWVIRKFRPDVIITRFPEDGRAGHGHHSASAILAREAFSAAADPKQFPEQLKYVKIWQAKRLVWNTFNFGGNNTTSDDQLKIDVGSFNALLGKGYGEIAAESRSNHKSQGFGSAKQRGPAIEYFSPVAGATAKQDLFEGIDQTWTRVKDGQEISRLIQEANAAYQLTEPSKSVPALVRILTAAEKLSDDYWKTEKIKKIKELLVAASGLWFESYAKQAQYALKESIPVNSQILIRPGNSIVFSDVSDLVAPPPAAQSNEIINIRSKISADQLSQPYWLAEKHAIGTYTINDPLLIGYPENPNLPKITFSFNIEGKIISFDRPVVYKYTDPVKGEIYQPLVIAPPVTATLAEKAYVFNGNQPRNFAVQLNSFKDGSQGTLIPVVPDGWKVSPEKIDFNLVAKGDQELVNFTVTPAGSTRSGTLSLKIQTDGQTFNRGLHVINYDHIPVQTLFPLAEARVEQVDLKISGKKIGYIAGAGDLVPQSLKQIGYEVTLLSDHEVLNTDLSGFDAIITGVRLYNINDRVKAMQPKLLKYVEAGGTLMIQYNVNSPLKINDLGPYPFKLTRDRVTEEDAKVSFLAPEHQVLNYPNKITVKDFDGWVQERGIYFATDIDPKYTAVLSMNDTGEKPSKGSPLVASYGKGKYVYSGLVFYRELPAGVPGAYRLLVNLISNQNTK
ncbi:PIG-L family deacetylase [Pedobacter sp.]|uniref:PIG-L family deacetylase n=1 Tax=Pedobacter sp. TaxID=1411316 RepID=UPI002C8B5523|nr:PIG-L family deacetylase [Pedobacter sp.]HWW41389.1 PIG-L family deacetylase [Pedobacter sp.]